MKILALDPAGLCGYAHSDGHHGTWIIKGRSGEHPGARLQRLEDFILDSAKAWGCELIAYEDAGFGSNNRVTQAGHDRLAGVIERAAFRLGIEAKAFNPMTIKAFATGNGHAKKDQMIRACQRLLKIVPADDNVADALWVLELAKRPDCWSVPKKVQKRRQRQAAKAAPKLF